MSNKQIKQLAKIEALELAVHYENYKWAFKHLNQLAERFPDIKGSEFYDELMSDIIGGEKMALAQINYGPLYMTRTYRRNNWDSSWAEARDSRWGTELVEE